MILKLLSGIWHGQSTEACSYPVVEDQYKIKWHQEDQPLNRKASFGRLAQFVLAGCSPYRHIRQSLRNILILIKWPSVACHGADGKGKAAQYPDLQGKPVEYIVAQLQYFKSGLRKSSTMNVVARSLSQEDMLMLAEFFNQVQ